MLPVGEEQEARSAQLSGSVVVVSTLSWADSVRTRLWATVLDSGGLGETSGDLPTVFRLPGCAPARTTARPLQATGRPLCLATTSPA